MGERKKLSPPYKRGAAKRRGSFFDFALAPRQGFTFSNYHALMKPSSHSTPRFALLGAALSLSACAQGTASGVPVLKVEVVRRYPHDPQAFTQGLLFSGGKLYEGTGLYRRSELREVDLESGKVLRSRKLPDDVFGEGLALANGKLAQLSWTNHLGFEYDAASFAPTRTFTYKTEGWGLTFDGKNLILSDGSSTLYFLNPATYAVERRVQVTADGQAVDQLNELEFIGGQVYANVWQTDRIARIDPQTGRVTAWIDVSNLTREVNSQNGDDVPNGIAYDAAGKRLFLTGKRWPTLFEVKIVGN